MANVFQIPIVNPFRFVNANVYDEIDPRYNTLPFDFKIDGVFNPNGFYAQKWQTNDFTAFQVDSDFNDVAFSVYVFDGGAYYEGSPYKNFAVTTPEFNVTFAGVPVSWKLYECVVSFAGFDEGMYVGVLTYTDQNGTVQNIQTSPLDIRVSHPTTMLYEYYNTENDKGIVWATGIKMSIRVEANIRDYTAESLAEEYVDQEYDVYSLNDIPYRTFLNLIGPIRGLPDWFIDKMNVIMTLNFFSADGTPYAKKPGQSIQITRPEKAYNEDGYAEVRLIPNENYNLAQYGGGTTPNGDFIVIAKQLPYYQNTANIAINGVFKIHTNLIGIAIWNRNTTAFVLNVGLTNGGFEIRQFNVKADATSFLLINKVFQSATNVFITSPAWPEVDLNIRYDDYDAPNTGSGGGTSSGPFFEANVCYEYFEDSVGNFVRDWNVGTGQGNPGTRFENCFMLNGQNNTINDAYLFRMGWDVTVPALRQTIQGNEGNQLTLTTSELPNSGLWMYASMVQLGAPVPTPTTTVARQRQAGGGLDYEAVASNGEPANIGLTSPLGDGNPMDITPETLVVVRFIYRTPA